MINMIGPYRRHTASYSLGSASINIALCLHSRDLHGNKKNQSSDRQPIEPFAGALATSISASITASLTIIK